MFIFELKNFSSESRNFLQLGYPVLSIATGCQSTAGYQYGAIARSPNLVASFSFPEKGEPVGF
jgi:hypothetical protein